MVLLTSRGPAFDNSSQTLSPFQLAARVTLKASQDIRRIQGENFFDHLVIRSFCYMENWKVIESPSFETPTTRIGSPAASSATRFNDEPLLL